MKLLIYTFLVITLNEASAQDINTPNILKNISKKNSELYLKRVKKYENKRVYTYAEKAALKVQREDILKSRVQLLAIKKGSILVDINSGETFLTSKEIISNAFTQEDYEGYFYLISKQKKVKFKVKMQETSSIKDIVNMYEKPTYFTPQSEKIDYNIRDNQFNFSYELSVVLGLANSSFINDAADIKDHYSNLISYEVGAFSKWDFEIQSGLLLQYETQSAKVSNVSYNMNTLLIGAMFEYQKANFLITNYNIGFKFYIDLVSRLNISTSSESDKINLSKNVLAFYANKSIYNFLDNKILVGFNYSIQWIKAKAQSSLYEVDSTSNTNNIYSLTVSLRGDYL